MLTLDAHGRIEPPARLRTTWAADFGTPTLNAAFSAGGGSSDTGSTYTHTPASAGIPGLTMTTAAGPAGRRATLYGPQINLATPGLVAVRAHAVFTGGYVSGDTGVNVLLELCPDTSPINVGARLEAVGSAALDIKTFNAAGSTTTGTYHGLFDTVWGQTDKQRQDIALWITPEDGKAYFGRGTDQLDLGVSTPMDIGAVIAPRLRISARGTTARSITVHRFEITAWYA